jgi:SAM-dependent methyltransferase
MPELDAQQRAVRLYDDYYRDGPSEWRRLGAVDKVGNILALCGQLPMRSVLEIGAGDGAILSRLSEVGFGDQLHAVEISSSGVDVIRHRGIPRLVEVSQFDGATLPYVDNRFDLAILSHVIEHLENPRQLVYEAARVARYIFVEVPTEDTSRRPDDYVPDGVGHINFFSRRTIRWLVQSCGLSVLGQITTNPSRETYVYLAGRRGWIQYHIKQTLLRWVPDLARRHFCYHEALLAARPPDEEHTEARTAER